MSDFQWCDAIVVGAGFAGMYALHRLRDDLGMHVRVFERGSDVGGTWYWNRYPGARCDVESMYYSYSFSDELEQEWEWTELFPAQPEILAYAEHVAERFELRKDITFATSVESAGFDESALTWTVRTDSGECVTTRFLITAVGCLSASRIPAFQGLDSFAGSIYHTGRWPHEEVDFRNKKVAVVGTGSSGVQAIPEIARQAEHLTVFQRTPTFSLPARNRPLTAQEIADFKATYPQRRSQARTAPSGVPRVPAVGSAFSVSDQRREELLTERWKRGGTSFLGLFDDTAREIEANDLSAEYVRHRIREIVENPTTAATLLPYDYPIGSKRICLDTDYYATYNRDNVDLVSVRETPIEQITSRGIRVGETEYEFDAIVFATGYDAMTGPLNAMDIRGTDGALLRDTWVDGPRTYLGIATAGFPNMFMLTAPGSPSVLVNMMISIEQHVDWVADLLGYLREHGYARVEADLDAQSRWVEHVNEAASRTLFPQGNSWYLGANIPGKPQVFMPYVAGAGVYREICDDVASDGYRGFTMNGSAPSSRNLLDPEIATVIAAFPPYRLSDHTLFAARERMRASAAAQAAGTQQFPTITCAERRILGIEGQPAVRVLYYEPQNRAKGAPALVWHHGGGYVMGTADNEDLTCRRIATATGAVVVSVDYRLAPETTAPGAFDDGYAVLKWLSNSADELGIDRTRIAVGGSSAGGGLAAALALRARDTGEFSVSFQLLLYPMLDDRTASTVEPHPYTGEFIWSAADNIYAWTSYLGGHPGCDGVSPYIAPGRVDDVDGLPPAFLCVGSLDLFAGEDITYAKRLMENGIATELHVHPGAPHGYNMVAGTRLALAHTRDFVDALDRHYRWVASTTS